jgi:hypothetical protein
VRFRVSSNSTAAERLQNRRGTTGELTAARWLSIVALANGPIGSLSQCRQSGTVEGAMQAQ